MKEPLLAPQPKSVVLRKGGFSMSPGDRALAAGYIRGGGMPDCVRLNRRAEPFSDVPGSYLLEVNPEGVEISSGDDAGVFYAVQTLKQLMGPDGRPIRCCRIQDTPDFETRMLMFDVSRDRVPSMETVKKLLDLAGEWKYNQFQLYTEHTFAYSEHNTVWKDASPFTEDEIRELDSYCADRFIEFVPNQNSFGHLERWLKHQQYRDLAESPDGFTDDHGVFREHSTTLSPAVPESIDFLSGLYDELLPCFSSEMLNVGGDEPWELGQGRSRELCNEIGLDRVYLDFLMKIRELAAERGRRIQIYGDIIMKYPHLISELPRDIILVNWGYEADHPFEQESRQTAESGIPFYICTGVSSWNSIGGRWSNTERNIKKGAEAGLRFGACGFAVSEWGDNGHWQQFPVGLPGFLYGACAAWNASALDSFDPVNHTARFIFGNDLRLAEAAMKIQDVWECSRIPLHNVSLPAVILLDPLYPYYRADYSRFRGYDFTAELRLLDEADGLLDEASPSDFREELIFSSALLRHGCRLGKLLLSTDQLSISAIEKQQRTELGAELLPLIEEYGRLWRNRSREGGLTDSLKGFNALMDIYQIG